MSGRIDWRAEVQFDEWVDLSMDAGMKVWMCVKLWMGRGGWIINYLNLNYLNFIGAEFLRTAVGALLDSDCRVLIRAKNKADVWDCVSRKNER